jgi:copper chaperone CopZ/uncharacterized membrane protein YphA (DoxX/SURF4 family)
MTHIYNITGMTCSGCEAKVQSVLSGIKGVKNVAIDLSKGNAIIDMGKHIPITELRSALKDYPRYQIAEASQPGSMEPVDETRSWVEIYKPVLLIFAYILGVTVLMEAVSGAFVRTRWMEHFMGGFFLTFSFFKLLNLRGFADSYSTYDIIAKKWYSWSYVYAFLELALGISFVIGFNPILTNSVTLVVMAVSIIGVVESVRNKRKIKCACLGDVFNLPMSTITIIEDALMIAMSGIMLVTLFL